MRMSSASGQLPLSASSSASKCLQTSGFQAPILITRLSTLQHTCDGRRRGERSHCRVSVFRVFRCAIDRPERYDSTDWAKALSTLPRSIILRRIRGHIIANCVASCLVLVFFDVLAQYAPNMVHNFNVTPLPHTFMVTAMSLLLVFRSNAAYDRFWEGRKLWGSVVSSSRNAARLCVATMPRSHANVATRLIVCYSYALMHHLQGRTESEPFESQISSLKMPAELVAGLPSVVRMESMELQEAGASIGRRELGRNGSGKRSGQFWGEAEWIESRVRMPTADVMLETINGADSKPLEVLLQLSTLIKLSLEWKNWVLKISKSEAFGLTVERDKLENCIFDLMDVLSKCERLVLSPVPLSWNRHTARLISLWTLTLPIVLVPIQGPLCIPTVAVISWVLFSIEEIGHILEDPFRQERYSIPLEEICETIKSDVLSRISDS